MILKFMDELGRSSFLAHGTQHLPNGFDGGRARGRNLLERLVVLVTKTNHRRLEKEKKESKRIPIYTTRLPVSRHFTVA
jgi:hypothetical protein